MNNLDQDVKDVKGRYEVVVVSPDTIGPAEKSLDKMLKDILAMVDYSDELEERIDKESDVTCTEDFQPLIVSTQYMPKILHTQDYCDQKMFKITCYLK